MLRSGYIPRYTTPRAGYIQGLRELADWYEHNPDVGLPHYGHHDRPLYVFGEEDTQSRMAELARRLAPCRKIEPYVGAVGLTHTFTGLTLGIAFSRSAVCTKRVTGIREIPERTEIHPARREEIIQWDCPPLMGVVNEEEA